eukprot:gene12209-2227_t
MHGLAVLLHLVQSIQEVEQLMLASGVTAASASALFAAGIGGPGLSSLTPASLTSIGIFNPTDQLKILDATAQAIARATPKPPPPCSDLNCANFDGAHTVAHNAQERMQEKGSCAFPEKTDGTATKDTSTSFMIQSCHGHVMVPVKNGVLWLVDRAYEINGLHCCEATEALEQLILFEE